eukprot:gene1935-33345_t
MDQYHPMHHLGHPCMIMTYPPAEEAHQAILDDAELFKITLNRLLIHMGISLKIPKVGAKEVDLHLLYREVTANGGLDVVTAKKQWVTICEPFNFPASFSHKSFVIKKLYINALHHCELVWVTICEPFNFPGSFANKSNVMKKLYVNALHHYEQVWVQVCEPFNFPKSFTNKSNVMKKLYIHGLHHYEQVVFHRNTGPVVPPPEISRDPHVVMGFNYNNRMNQGHGRPKGGTWGLHQTQPGPTTGYYSAGGGGGGGQMMPGTGLKAHDLQTGFRFPSAVESTFKDGYNPPLEELDDGQRIQAPMHLRPASHRGNQHHVDSAVVTGSELVCLDHHAMHRGGQEHGQGGGLEHVRLDHHAMHRGGQEHGQGGGSEHVRLDHHAMHRRGQEHGQGGGSEHVRLDHHAMHRGGQEHGQGGGSEHVRLDHHAMRVVECNIPRMQHKRAAADTGAANGSKRQRSATPVEPRSALFFLANSISPAEMRAAFPDGGNMDVATVKLAGDRWCNMRSEERQPYYDKADADRQRYTTETARLAGQVVTSNQCSNTAYAGNSSRATSRAATGNGDGAQDPPVSPPSTHSTLRTPYKVHPCGTGAGGGDPFLATPNSGPAQGGPFLATPNSGPAQGGPFLATPNSGPAQGGPFLATPNIGPARGGAFLATPNSDHAHYSQGCRQNNMPTAVKPGPPNHPTALNATHQRAVEAAGTAGPPPVTPTADQSVPPNHPMAAALIKAAHQRAIEAAGAAGAPTPLSPHMLGLHLGTDAHTTTQAFGGTTTYGGHGTKKLQYYSSGSHMCNHGENNTLGPSPMSNHDKYWDELIAADGGPHGLL